MKYLLALLLISSAFCLNEDYGCEDVCPCGHMNQTVPFSGNYQYSEQTGCLRTIMCREGGSTTPLSTWTTSEIPKPAGSIGNFFFLSTSGGPNVPNGDFVDLFSYFGIVCKDNAWFATKYPKGISYPGPSTVYTGSDGSLDGKASRISTIACSN